MTVRTWSLLICETSQQSPVEVYILSVLSDLPEMPEVMLFLIPTTYLAFISYVSPKNIRK